MTEKEIRDLVASARNIAMTPKQRETQRRSFAFGNANIENARVTREVVNAAARELQEQERARTGKK